MKPAGSGRVLITDGNSRRTLAVVRSLGRRGLHVVAGHNRPSALAFSSKYCREHFIYPDPKEAPEEFLSEILDRLRTGDYDCFLPMGDETMGIAAGHQGAIAELTRLIVPSSASVETALDKGKTVRFAEARGFPCPGTFFVDDLGTINRLKSRIPYPAVIKPRTASGAQGVVFVDKPAELYPTYLRVHHRFPFPLIQEAILPESPKYGVQCLFNGQGRLRAAYVQRFLRQYPANGGPGSWFETVLRPDILEQGVRLLELLDWKGVAQVEFMEDARDGSLKLLEINPRFWDSLQTIIQAGVDFPYLLYRIAVEGDVEPRLDYQSGEICRSILPGELLYLIASRGRALFDPAFRKIRGPHLGHSIWDKNDIRPVLGFIRIALEGLLDRETRDSMFHRL
ncbi:MAG: carboxylate--amine ligase [Candidatus Aminicenantales bacterium]